MAVLSFKVGTYARQIYLAGTQRFTARDGYTGIPFEYHEPVMKYAVANFYLFDIDNALSKGWISQEEYEQTLSYGEPKIAPTFTSQQENI